MSVNLIHIYIFAVKEAAGHVITYFLIIMEIYGNAVIKEPGI